MKPAADPGLHRHWEKVVLACYLRMLGSSQKAAGAAVGRSERTIRVWEADTETWAQACAEARQRWLGEVISLARRQLLKAMMNADGDLSLKLLERVDEALAPASMRLKHEGTVNLSTAAEWVALRTTMLRALAPYPEARLALAQVLSGDEAPGYESRNGTSNGSRY